MSMKTFVNYSANYLNEKNNIHTRKRLIINN